jgi:hypothetical protein
MRRALLAMVLCACAHQTPRAEAPLPSPGVEVQGDTVTRTFDLNGDGKPDDWKVFRLIADPSGRTWEALIERRLDTNFDGKPDLTTWYDESGARVREAFDLDFDGKVDVVNHYEKGELVRKEIFRGDPARPDTVAFYEGGKRVRVESKETKK